MPEQVPVQVARERNRVLRELIARKKQAFMDSFIGREVEAITLTHFDGEYTEGLTDNYLKLRVRGKHASNRWMHSLIHDTQSDSLIGTIRRFS